MPLIETVDSVIDRLRNQKETGFAFGFSERVLRGQVVPYSTWEL